MADRFVEFCRERGLFINRERLIRLECLGLFAPVFRVRMPKIKTLDSCISPGSPIKSGTSVGNDGREITGMKKTLGGCQSDGVQLPFL